MPRLLPDRVLHVAAVALLVAGIDWALKAWATAALRPDQIVLNTNHPWHLVVASAVIAVGLVAVARTRLLALGAGVVIGGGLGNMAELAVHGRVTDFVPLGIPFRGAVWSPADFFLAGGLVLLWVGAVRHGRSPTLSPDALQARDPLHGHRRRARRQGHPLP
jgi:lipoprotein signal peptidase